MTIKRKPRGLKRKCRNMITRIEQATRHFPQPHPNSGYWHLHLPVASGFIDSAATPHCARKLCVQILLERAFHLTTLAPPDQLSRVVVAAALPDLWASQIIVFFSQEYFSSFFTRDSDQQKWIALNEKSLAKKWSLALPKEFEEKGFRQEIVDEDRSFINELWFFGQL